MTRGGFETLQNELKRRTTTDRHEIVKAIAEARAHGDLSENAEYHAAKEQQGLNEGRIQELESAIATAEIIDIETMKSDSIKFGATITLLDLDSDNQVKYQIVGAQEANAEQGKISISSPLARALINKTCEDEVEVIAPASTKNYAILKIEYIA